MKAVPAASVVPAAEPAAEPSPKLRPRFLHAPIRKQVMLLTLCATFGGAVAGMIEAHLGHQGWPLMCGMLLVVCTVSGIGRRWITQPIERLVESIREAGQVRRPTRRSEKPLDATNEIDLLGEYVHQLSVEAYRQSTAVNQLRRTLDHRIAAATRKATQQLEQLALRDPLTDLANRRFVQEHLDAIVTSCRSANTDLVCVAIDLDGFKGVNDTLGHAKGDELLKFLSHVIRSSIRNEDYAVRLGGDEFLLFIPGCELDKVSRVLDRIRALFHQHLRVALPPGMSAGLSFGVSSLRRDGVSTGAALMQVADEHLYAAKAAGKGCAVGL